MANRVDSAVIVGAGTAGFLTAIAFRRLNPEIQVAVLHSPSIPVIGVGESTTAFFPIFLHIVLGLDQKQFYHEVRPSWKMGVQFDWGDPADSHFYFSFDDVMTTLSNRAGKMNAFYCLEDWRACARFWALMDKQMSPCMIARDGSPRLLGGFGYHIENRKFLAYLQKKAVELGVQILTGDVVHVPLAENGDVACLQLDGNRQVKADLYVDCSGSASILLGKALGDPYTSYEKSLFCDTAVVGSWQRDDVILPYTRSETMDHGWCWGIEFENHVTRGYVFSSQACSPDQAMRELKAKNPRLPDDLRVVKFPRGRYENFWRNNVAAIGNSSAFVEPLEATALHLIATQILTLSNALKDCNRFVVPEIQSVACRLFRQNWDEVRDFICLHYKFNRRLDTPFWRHCRNDTPLGTLQPLVDFYQQVGPALACDTFIPKQSIFHFNGYMMILIGMRVPTKYRNNFTPRELADWQSYRQNILAEVGSAVPVREGLNLVHHPMWKWSKAGV